MIYSCVGREEVKQCIGDNIFVLRNFQFEMWKVKLGFLEWNTETHNLLLIVLQFMNSLSVDYTIFWRELAYIASDLAKNNDMRIVEDCFNVRLLRAFYYPEKISGKLREQWLKWLVDWSTELQAQEVKHVC